MGRPAKEEILSLRNGSAEIVVRVTAPNKQAARELRPTADDWLSREGRIEVFQMATRQWLLQLGSSLKNPSAATSRQQPLPFDKP